MPARILVVDDEPLKRVTLQIELGEAGFEVCEAADALAARRILDTRPVDVVVSDVRMPGESGLDLLTYVKQNYPAVEVILMTAYGTIDTAVLAIKRGAYDYITKPFTTPELLAKLERLLTARRPVATDDSVATFGRAVARNTAMKRVLAQLREVAASDRPILIIGEAGTGKQLLADAVHESSPRREKSLVRFRCGSLPPEALAAELFGVEKGALPGIARQKSGRIELADAGTLLLDEVERLPADGQDRLVGLLERGEIQRIGGERTLRVNVRLIVAAACDPKRLVQAGALREELYYRLGVISVTVPPLRARPDDIPLLADHLLRRHVARFGDSGARLSPPAVDELLRYAWPGNVRELEHVLERTLAFCEGDEIRPEHILPLGSADAGPVIPAVELAEVGRLPLTDTVAEIERRMILLALRQSGHNQARAAQRLGIPRTTLRDKMAKYAIPAAVADTPERAS